MSGASLDWRGTGGGAAITRGEVSAAFACRCCWPAHQGTPPPLLLHACRAVGVQLLGMHITNCTATAVIVEPPESSYAADQVLALPDRHPGAVLFRDVAFTFNTG